MRLWSVHPEYLEAKGLVALWREALLARKVLAGETRGYTRHPQLERFRAAADPIAAINAYLREVLNEAKRRGYSFDSSKLLGTRQTSIPAIPVERGQLRYELALLRDKLSHRAPERLAFMPELEELHTNADVLRIHPLFTPQDGGIASWERVLPDILRTLEESPQ
jgi:hypothetical protein